VATATRDYENVLKAILENRNSLFAMFPYNRHIGFLDVMLLDSGWTPHEIELAYTNFFDDAVITSIESN
jgi:hypothetical protein